MGHLEYRVSRQERTTEWIAVKPVKQESKSLTHFSTTIYCYEIDSILTSQLLSKHILHVNNNQHFGRDERRETASTSCRGLWVLFDVQMAFHDCKYNIFTFSFFHLFLIFEIKCQRIFCRYINTWGGALCGKLSDACKGGTSSSGEQSKDVCKTTQHLLHPQTVFLHPHAHSQEKPFWDCNNSPCGKFHCKLAKNFFLCLRVDSTRFHKASLHSESLVSILQL